MSLQHTITQFAVAIAGSGGLGAVLTHLVHRRRSRLEERSISVQTEAQIGEMALELARSLRAEIDNYRADADRVRDELNHLRNDTTRERQAMDQELRTLRAENADLKRRLGELSSRLDKLRAEHADQAGTIEALTAERDELAAQVNALEQELATLRGGAA